MYTRLRSWAKNFWMYEGISLGNYLSVHNGHMRSLKLALVFRNALHVTNTSLFRFTIF